MKYRNVKIYQRNDSKTYYARPTIEHKQIYIKGRTAREVYEKLRELYNSSKPMLKENKKETNILTLNKWIDKWLELYKYNIVSKRTLDDILAHRKNYFTNKIFDLDIKTITTIQLLTLINNIKFERTKQKVYTFLKDIFNKAYLNHIITLNPMDTITKPKHKSKEKNFTRRIAKIK